MRRLWLAATGLVVVAVAVSLVHRSNVRADDAETRASVAEAVNADTIKNLRAQVADLKRQQRELVTYFEDSGRVVPSNLGGTGPPATTVIRESSGGGTRTIRHDSTTTRVQQAPATTQPTQNVASGEPQSSDSDEPIIDIPDVPVQPVQDVKEKAGDLLDGTPLEGAF